MQRRQLKFVKLEIKNRNHVLLIQICQEYQWRCAGNVALTMYCFTQCDFYFQFPTTTKATVICIYESYNRDICIVPNVYNV